MEFSFIFSRKDYFKYAVLNLFYELNTRIILILLFLFNFFLYFSEYGFRLNGLIISIGFITASVVTFFATVLIVIVRSLILIKYIHDNPELFNHKINYRIDAKLISCRTAIGESRFLKRTLIKTTETKNCFYLRFRHSMMEVIIPIKAFGGPDEIARFKHALR